MIDKIDIEHQFIIENITLSYGEIRAIIKCAQCLLTRDIEISTENFLKAPGLKITWDSERSDE